MGELLPPAPAGHCWRTRQRRDHRVVPQPVLAEISWRADVGVGVDMGGDWEGAFQLRHSNIHMKGCCMHLVNFLIRFIVCQNF